MKEVLFSMCFLENMNNVLASMHVGTKDEPVQKVPVLRVEYTNREEVFERLTQAINIMLDRFEEQPHPPEMD
jgi:hypothetical protein